MRADVMVGKLRRAEWVVEERYRTRRGNQDIFSTPNLMMPLEEAAI